MDQTSSSSVSELDRPWIRQTWPEPRTFTLLEAVNRWLPEAGRDLSLQAQLVEQFANVPVVAIAGLLNSGKSSVAGSFLSPAGRERVLAGLGEKSGTQRFTLWVPVAWRSSSNEKVLLDLFSQVFGGPVETLSDEPTRAREQQADSEAVESVLLATDPSLDKHGVALLDCPDLQREHHRTAERLKMVERSAAICTAAILVTARNQLEIGDLHEVMQRLPNADIIWALNLIRDEPAHEAAADARSILGLAPGQPVYGAYDFLSRVYKEHTPVWDPLRQLGASERQTAAQPCFFLIDDRPEQNKPDRIQRDRAMTKIASQITRDDKKHTRQNELQKRFSATLDKTRSLLAVELEKIASERRLAERKLQDECLRLLQQDGRLRVRMSPDILHQFEESLTRTAAPHYKVLLIPSRKVLQGCEKLFQLGKNMTGVATGNLDKQKEALEKKLGKKARQAVESGVIRPDDLQRALSLWSGAAGDYQPPEKWTETAEHAITRFVSEEKSNLTPDEWDAVTTHLWKNLPLRARVKVYSSLFLLMGSLFLALFDGGISFVAVKTADLLGGIGVLASVGVNIRGAQEFQETLEDKLGRRQLSNLHAILCDIVGLPRPEVSDEWPEATVPEALLEDAYGLRKRHWAVYESINQYTVS